MQKSCIPCNHTSPHLEITQSTLESHPHAEIIAFLKASSLLLLCFSPLFFLSSQDSLIQHQLQASTTPERSTFLPSSLWKDFVTAYEHFQFRWCIGALYQAALKHSNGTAGLISCKPPRPKSPPKPFIQINFPAIWTSGSLHVMFSSCHLALIFLRAHRKINLSCNTVSVIIILEIELSSNKFRDYNTWQKRGIQLLGALTCL